jgi:acyl-CoA thioester hydrolase
LVNADKTSARILAVGDIHQVELPLRWGDSDALNHLNNAMYFRLMEEARIQILYGAGFALPADQGLILAHASCDFLRPLTYPANVLVTHKLMRIGRSSAEFELLLEKAGDEGGPYARARNVLVWMDYVVNASAPWPQEVLSKLGARFKPGA